MNPLIQLKTTPPLLITLALFGFGLLPRAQAIVPAPDGGYPNFTTAEGTNALLNLTSGAANTGLGWSSLLNVTTGSFNTSLGAGTLALNNGDQNTATGAGALLSNTTGSQSTANGAFALFSNTEGNVNTAIGDQALFNNTTGFANTANGEAALFSNTEGSSNTANGVNALVSNTTGGNNTALGFGAGNSVSTASNVICVGANVFGADVSNSCFIGNIYSNVQPIVGTDPDSVTINSNGRLGRGNVSSRRYKHDIKPMDTASETLYALKPVSFRYNKEYDGTQTLAFGLIAEEVAEVAPDLVGRNPDGQPESVRYEQVNVMLLNEFLKEHHAFVKEHRKVDKLEATVTGLVATVKEQAAQIQKVSAQLEASKSAPQVVNNP
jgi:trimeric autotransporter adhesin